MKLKPFRRPPQRRQQLQALLNQPSRSALGRLLEGYKEQGESPSSGTTDPRQSLQRMNDGTTFFGRFEGTLDRLIADTLVNGVRTNSVMNSVFSIARGLKGR